MKYFNIFVIIYSGLIFSNVIFAADLTTVISGYIYNSNTGEPIEDVNVYISNTTWGSSTNREGYFQIRQIPVGMQEIVVTIVGYKYESKRVLVREDSQLKIDFKLEPLIYEADTTFVEGTYPTAWYNDLEFFKKHFLGQSDFARGCQIENEIYLEFKRPNDSFFLASVEQPLIIMNYALGYRIDCVLVNFTYNYDKRNWSWAIKPKFSELESEDPAQLEEWRENRQKAYRGSVFHFLKSFRSFRLEAEEYDVYNVETSGQKIPQQYWYNTLIDYQEYISDGLFGDEKKLHFKNFLFVVFKKSATSWIGLNYTDITLDEFGYPLEDNPCVIYGDWARRAVGDLVPKNYTSD